MIFKWWVSSNRDWEMTVSDQIWLSGRSTVTQTSKTPYTHSRTVNPLLQKQYKRRLVQPVIASDSTSYPGHGLPLCLSLDCSTWPAILLYIPGDAYFSRPSRASACLYSCLGSDSRACSFRLIAAPSCSTPFASLSCSRAPRLRGLLSPSRDRCARPQLALARLHSPGLPPGTAFTQPDPDPISSLLRDVPELGSRKHRLQHHRTARLPTSPLLSPSEGDPSQDNCPQIAGGETIAFLSRDAAMSFTE
jgi:hypothetical protein